MGTTYIQIGMRNYFRLFFFIISMSACNAEIVMSNEEKIIKENHIKKVSIYFENLRNANEKILESECMYNKEGKISIKYFYGKKFQSDTCQKDVYYYFYNQFGKEDSLAGKSCNKIIFMTKYLYDAKGLLYASRNYNLEHDSLIRIDFNHKITMDGKNILEEKLIDDADSCSNTEVFNEFEGSNLVKTTENYYQGCQLIQQKVTEFVYENNMLVLKKMKDKGEIKFEYNSLGLLFAESYYKKGELITKRTYVYSK